MDVDASFDVEEGARLARRVRGGFLALVGIHVLNVLTNDQVILGTKGILVLRIPAIALGIAGVVLPSFVRGRARLERASAAIFVAEIVLLLAAAAWSPVESTQPWTVSILFGAQFLILGVGYSPRVAVLLLAVAHVGSYGLLLARVPSELPSMLPVLAPAVAFGLLARARYRLTRSEHEARAQLEAAHARLREHDAELDARLQEAIARIDRDRDALRSQREGFVGELHDGVNASLARAAVLLGAEPVDGGSRRDADLAHARRALAEALEETRSLMDVIEQRPREASEVLASCRRAAREVLAGSGLVTDLRLELPERPLSPAVAHALLRAVGEGLTNVVRHANARHVTLSIEQAHERIRLTIVDDGVGLERPTGRGLSVLARRVERLGGRSEISRAEAATRLVVELPFHEPSR